MVQQRAARSAPSRSGGPRHAPAPRPGPAPAPAPAAKAAPEPSSASPIDRTSAVFLDLQAQAGNAAVTDLIARPPVGPVNAAGVPLQRSQISYRDAGETLYNQTPDVNPSTTPGTAAAAFYSSGDIKYEMVRTASGVNVTVKVLFIDQARDTNRTLAGGADNPNYLGHVGPETAIPDGDARRDFATNMCGRVTTNWNGKLVFVSKQQPAAGETKPDGSPAEAKDVRLPVTFKAVPTFDPAATGVHSKVRVYGPTVEADAAAGHPIDAGNYYMNTEGYGASAEAIYAHEYGHLIGLNDEYSQSNHQMHALLHKASPTLGGARGEALDKASVERMVMAALTRPLAARLRSAQPEIGRSFKSLKAPMTESLTKAIATTVSASTTNFLLSLLLLPRVSERLRKYIGTVVDFQLGKNFSAKQIARTVVNEYLSPRILSNVMVNAYLEALTAIHETKADVGGGPSGQISITIHGDAASQSGIWGAAKSGALAGTASNIADNLVGPKGGKVPPAAPSPTLISQIHGIPAEISAAAATAGAMINEGAVRSSMWSGIISGTEGPPIDTMGKLYRQAYNVVQFAAQMAADEEVNKTLMDKINPLVTANVSTLRDSVREEVGAIMVSSAGSVASTAPKDPEIAAVATAMKARLDAQTPAGRTDANPARPGAATTEPAAGSQEITYSNTGMMSDNSTDIRPDQFERMVKEFNDRQPDLRKEREDAFKAEKT